jgi:Protein of unknown function (DUF3551)
MDAVHRILVASATLGLFHALVVTTAMTTTAMARDYPFCIKGCDFTAGPGDCSFVSYQQCQATAAGRTAYCSTNPYFHGAAETPSRTNLSRRSR